MCGRRHRRWRLSINYRLLILARFLATHKSSRRLPPDLAGHLTPLARPLWRCNIICQIEWDLQLTPLRVGWAVSVCGGYKFDINLIC